MARDVKVEKFEGPLGLLLQLIEGEELNITEISLSKVTEQFFEYLRGLDEAQADEMADFLVVATKLVYVKSRHLLPYLSPAEDEGPSLAEQLKLYKRYAEASAHVADLWQAGQVAYGRLEPPIKQKGFTLPANAKEYNLRQSFLDLLKRLKPLAPLPEVSIDHRQSVKQKIESIYQAVLSLERVWFKDVLTSAASRTEVIVSFLALLELLKQDKVRISQTDSFEDMEIRVK